MDSFEQARINMVESQIRPSDITDRRILDAMAEVPRELFVPPAQRPFAYADMPVPLGEGRAGQPPRRLMEPRVFAKLVHALAVRPGDLVLDIGCATGYSSAVLSRLADAVVALESDELLAERANALLPEVDAGNVAVVTGTLQEGYPSEGPYDVILINGAVEQVPEALFGQLNEAGRLAAIFARGVAGKAWLHVRHSGQVSGRPIFDASAPPLPGFVIEESFVF